MSITIKSGAKVLYQWERGVALTASTPCDILRISREDDRVTDDLYPVISGSTGTALIPDRMLTESGYLHISRIDHADGSERVLETVRILVRHAAKPQNTASSTKEIDDIQTIRMQMAALERAAREGKFDGKDGTTPHIGENGNWWLGDDDTGIPATGDDGITPHIGGNGNWYVGDADTGVKATGDDGITPNIGDNGNWYVGDTDTGVKATGDDGITPHIGENGNWYIGDEDTGVFARNEDVSLYADDMYTSGILEKGAMQLKILEPSGSNVIRYEIESAVVYIKGIRRARGGFTTSTQAVNFERLMANILRLNVEKGTFSWRVAEVTRDGDSLVNIDNGEIYPARSGGYYDLIPYLVHIPAGATSITYDMVEDLRADERYCGYVRDRLAPAKVSELENDAGYVTEDELAYKANGIIDTARGEVLALTDSAEAPLSGLVVYGKSTQDGTPTPDAPVPIVSVGEDGVTKVCLYGKNLFLPMTLGTQNEVTLSKQDDYYVLNGTPKAPGNFIVKGDLPAGRYTLSANNPSHNSLSAFVALIQVYSANTLDSIIAEDNKSNSTGTKTIKAGNYEFRVRYQAGVTYNNFIIKPQLEIGEVATEYEPATPKTLFVPYTLCGIPVTSGGNYTDASGQQWVCDEIDFVRGVRVQRVCKVDMSQLGFVIDSQGYWKTSALVGTIKTDSNNPPLLSDKYTASSWSEKSYGNISMNDAGWVASLNGSTTERPSGTLHYALLEPIETPLTEEELAAYRALQTNYPNTTIYADDNAGLSVGYSADTKLYIDKKFAELAAAIVNN